MLLENREGITKKEENYDHQANQRLYRLRDMRQNLSHGCNPSESENKKSVHQVSGRLPDLSFVQDVLAYVEELRDHHVPMLRAADLHELRLAHETANMIISAEMKLKASLMRKESRCSHFRLDYPEMDTKNWNAWINIYKGRDGEMKLEKQPFDSWPS
jgi:succinate dehydrogenase/fumarate reductase flavoprotein subunit